MTNEKQSLSFGNVVGHGVDVIDMPDFARMINHQAGAFLDRYFTQGELAVAGEANTRIEKLASRLAIKEAVLKALGTGWGDGIAFTDVEVTRHQTGAPSVVLHRQLVTIAREQGIVRWLVSSSHTATVATASVIALSS
ncbi:MAG: holo-ACP synthase [Burkholderiales bacterium]|nr:holo-ACP synthase [Burkholderiales bacterium]